jgi:hypothetical protein
MLTGSVFNTKLLDYKARHEYKFHVTAEDCDGVKSSNIQVTVHVKAICFVSWTGGLLLIYFTYTFKLIYMMKRDRQCVHYKVAGLQGMT